MYDTTDIQIILIYIYTQLFRHFLYIYTNFYKNYTTVG